MVTQRCAEKYVESLLTSVYQTQESELNRYELRGSSLPFCTMLKLAEFLESPTKTRDFGFQFYVSVGTAIHETLQSRFIISDKRHQVVAKWPYSCASKTMTKQEFKDHVASLPVRSRPKEFKKCKKFPACGCEEQGVQTFEEIDFDYYGLTGHLDLLTKFKLSVDDNGTYFAWEFKSTSDESVTSGSYLPQDKHEVQIQTYCLLLRLLYGIRVEYYALVYFSRNKPGKLEEDPWLAKRLASSHRAYVKKVSTALLKPHLDQVKRAIRSYRASIKLLGLLKPETYSKERVYKYLSIISENRPCQTEAEYKNYGKRAFFGREHCPFSNNSCFNGHSTRNPISSIKEQIKVHIARTKATKT